VDKKNESFLQSKDIKKRGISANFTFFKLNIGFLGGKMTMH